jgi:hypothetical protein
MKKILVLATALAVSASLGACNSPGERAAGGAVLGGLGGAAVGAAVSNGSAGGALAGAAIGAAGGALVGAATAPERRCAKWGRDYDGNRFCRAYYEN